MKLCACRDAQLSDVFDQPGVMLTTYGMVQHNAQLLCQPPGVDYEEGDPPLWDFLILDEASRLLPGQMELPCTLA